MFQSAVRKLTAWYVIALIAVVFILSIPVYSIASNRLDRATNRGGQLVEDFGGKRGRKDLPPDFRIKRDEVIRQERDQLFRQIMLIDIFIILFGAVGSYYFAKYTLEPIEEAHDAQSRFTSDASHELRTPLAVMQAEIELAIRQNDKKIMASTLESNLEEVERLQILSNQLLSLTKVDNNNLDYKKFSLSKSLSKHVNSITKHYKNKFVTKIAPGVSFYGDESLILEAVTILINNAIQYSNTEDSVEVKLTQNKKHIFISVRDFGVGIKQSEQNRIFERFFRGSNSSQSIKGHGLGLSLAQEIAHKSRGNISVKSEIGKGSTFTLELPK